jgi:CHAD domain-containing protein
MPFRLKSNEDLNDGLPRIYSEQLDAALAKSLPDSDGSISRQVHEIRKHLKKMRAVLRLARAEIGPKQFKAVNRRLRDAGRKLSPVRDAEVRVTTIDTLCDRFFEQRREFPKIRGILARDSRECASKAPAALRTVAASLRAARREARRLKLSGVDMCDSLRRVYKQARQAFAAARQDSTRTRLHNLRKRLKDLWYQLRIVRPVRPEVLDEQVRQAKLLTEYLGESLDLAVIHEALTDHHWTTDATAEREALFPILDARRSRLDEAALDLCRSFFSETPMAFAKRVSGYFQERA